MIQSGLTIEPASVFIEASCIRCNLYLSMYIVVVYPDLSCPASETLFASRYRCSEPTPQYSIMRKKRGGSGPNESKATPLGLQ